MPPISSRAPATMTQLQVLWQAALAASAHPEVNVFLGPVYSGDPDDAVFVGYDGNPDGEFETVTHRQGWVGAGARARDEEFDVHCCILNVSGVGDPEALTAATTRLYSVFQVLALAVHSDRGSLGLGPGSAHNAPVFQASVQSFTSYLPTVEGGGVQPRVSFDVHVRTRV